MKIGILGLPGSGKSTLFRLLALNFDDTDFTHAANKPRLQRVEVKDPRLERLRDDYKPKKFTPAAIELLDFPAVARPGTDKASLADLLAPARETEALILVLRAFDVPGQPASADPVVEYEAVRSELCLSDLVVTERRLERLEQKSRKPSFKDEDRRERALLEKVHQLLEAERPLVELELSPDDRKLLGGFGFLSAKPFVVVVSTDGSAVNDAHRGALGVIETSQLLIVPVRNELDILELPDEERGEFLREYGLEKFQRDDVLRAAAGVAERINFFTVGDKEVRAWTIRAGETAREAAGAIHSDMQRGFIRAEVVSYGDYVAHEGVKGAKSAGVYRLEPKDYRVQDGDIIVFRFSV